MLCAYIAFMNNQFDQNSAFSHRVFGAGAPTLPYAKGGIWAFLVWIKVWLGLCSGERGAGKAAPAPEPINRYYKRLAGKTIGSERMVSNFLPFCRKDITPTQFAERLCALSIFGRVDIYSMRYWAKTMDKRAVLSCYDHGWWRNFAGKMGRVPCGVWRVHLWPF